MLMLIWLHFRKMMLESVLSPMWALCGLIIIPLWQKRAPLLPKWLGLNAINWVAPCVCYARIRDKSSGSSSSSSSILASSSAHMVKYLWYSDSGVVAISFTDVPVFGQEYLARSLGNFVAGFPLELRPKWGSGTADAVGTTGGGSTLMGGIANVDGVVTVLSMLTF